MKVCISGRHHSGSVTVPPSKSLSHRALLAAALANGESTIKNLGDSQDIQASMACLSALGARIHTENGSCLVKGRLAYTGLPLDCQDSGSTLRFLLPLAATLNTPVAFLCSGQLLRRPQSVYEKLFEAQNIRFEKRENGYLVDGQLKPGNFRVQGDVSSQFISGLLYALPLLDGDSRLEVQLPFESASYVQLTLEVLKQFGIEIYREQHNVFRIAGGQCYKAAKCTIEGDWSQAAFFGVLGALGEPVSLLGLNKDSQQGDRILFDYLIKCGAEAVWQDEALRVSKGALQHAEFDLSDCPDLGPALAALIAGSGQGGALMNAERLRYKESDRLAALAQDLTILGFFVKLQEDALFLTSHTPRTHVMSVRGFGDHRIVMAMAVLATVLKHPVIIEEAQAVAKSYPDFFEKLSRFGVEVSYDE